MADIGLKTHLLYWLSMAAGLYIVVFAGAWVIFKSLWWLFDMASLIGPATPRELAHDVAFPVPLICAWLAADLFPE